tara:strand:- start:2733 stop:3209 length:477 start_codon:yes stop_codon:yes gene_type:complete
MYGNKPSRRDVRMSRKRSLDMNKIDNYLKELQDSYQPSAWKPYVDVISNILKLSPNPVTKGIGYTSDFATDFMDRPRYDAPKMPNNLEYGDNIIKEANKKANLMNQLLEERMWTDAIQTAAEFGFKEVKIKDPKDPKGKMVGSGKSLFDMLLERLRRG